MKLERLDTDGDTFDVVSAVAAESGTVVLVVRRRPLGDGLGELRLSPAEAYDLACRLTSHADYAETDV